MSLIKLPAIKASNEIAKIKFNTRQDAVERWEPNIKASTDSENTISMYGVVGDDWESNPITAKRISAALRHIGDNPVTVNLNSPGGDFFEGVAIFNLLRQHPQKVTINILGLAASAASVIAMAGDEINIGEGSFLMIHNAWCFAMGNRHDMLKASETLAPFDNAMADVYSARTELDLSTIKTMMDKETWINSSQALEDGFATGNLPEKDIEKIEGANAEAKALAVVETALAQAGYPRSQRRGMLKDLFNGKPCATEETKPCAGEVEALQNLTKLFRNQ